MKSLTRQTKIALGVSFIAIVSFAAAITYAYVAEEDPRKHAPRPPAVVRADSHRLDTAKDNNVTFVEFLDFECEACGAAYPFVEQLRKDYAGRVTFVARYFPLPGHRNSRTAAWAVEAAARQGKFEEMYQRMFETQRQWGEQQESMAPLFRTYAKDLGLDMAQYDRDVNSPSVVQRVQKDFDDGQALGVTGTPSFFLNGKKLTIATKDDFTTAIDAALAK